MQETIESLDQQRRDPGETAKVGYIFLYKPWTKFNEYWELAETRSWTRGGGNHMLGYLNGVGILIK